MNKTFDIVSVDGSIAIRDNRDRRLLSLRFRDEESAKRVIDSIEPSDDSMITLADVAREVRMTAFQSRSVLRSLGMRPSSGRWKILRNSPEHGYIHNILKAIKQKTKH